VRRHGRDPVLAITSATSSLFSLIVPRRERLHNPCLLLYEYATPETSQDSRFFFKQREKKETQGCCNQATVDYNTTIPSSRKVAGRNIRDTDGGSGNGSGHSDGSDSGSGGDIKGKICVIYHSLDHWPNRSG